MKSTLITQGISNDHSTLLYRYVRGSWSFITNNGGLHTSRRLIQPPNSSVRVVYGLCDCLQLILRCRCCSHDGWRVSSAEPSVWRVYRNPSVQFLQIREKRRKDLMVMVVLVTKTARNLVRERTENSCGVEPLKNQSYWFLSLTISCEGSGHSHR